MIGVFSHGLVGGIHGRLNFVYGVLMAFIYFVLMGFESSQTSGLLNLSSKFLIPNTAVVENSASTRVLNHPER